jgi:hypothetical protein
MKYTPEQARHALIDMEGRDFGWTTRYFEAIRDGELPSFYGQVFASFKLYSDDLPGHRLVSEWHPDYPVMKCRAHTIIGIIGYLSAGTEDEVITDENLKTTINEFIAGPWNSSRPGASKGEFWTTPEEIQRMNTMLDTVIAYLEKTYGIQPDWDKARQEIELRRRQLDYLR